MTVEHKYMVFVQNGHSPVKVHEGDDSAFTEACRLAKTNPGRIVRVLRIVNEMIGEVTVKEIFP